MKKIKLLTVIFLSSTILTSNLTSCNNNEENSQTNTTSSAVENTTSSTNEKKDEQVSNLVLVDEPGSLDASKATDLYSSMVLCNVMAGLTKPVFEGDKEVPKEDGAEKIDVSDDGLVWTFHIRNMNWSDGKPVTAQDYAYSIMRTLDPNTASQYAFLLYTIDGAQEYNTISADDTSKIEEARSNVKVIAKDDKTLEITLKSPCAYFKQTTYFKVFYPQRQDFVEKNGTTYGADADKLLYCGPYTIKEWKHKDTVTLIKNNNYWDKDNYPLEVVNLRIIPDTDTSFAEFEAGNVDAISQVPKPEWFSRFQNNPDMENIKQNTAGVSYFGFNENPEYNSVFKNLKLRQAVSAALNREESVEELYGVTGVPGYDWCHGAFELEPGLNYRTVAGKEPIKTLKEKITDPKATFIEGIQELGLGNDPANVTIKLYTATSLKNHAEYFQAQLQQDLGCKVETDLSDWALYQEKTNRYEHDMYTHSWSADYNDPMTMFEMFLSGANMSNTGMANKKFDELVQQAGSLPAEKNEERIKLFSEAENILLIDECAVSPWSHRIRNGFKYSYLKNYQPSIFGALNLRSLSIDGKNK